MLRILTLSCALALTATAALPFEIGFEWGDFKSCTNGSPRTVANPRFDLKDVPEGTKFIRFKLVDRNKPDFDHGGGTVAWTGETVIEPGAFTYRSPCPPNGSHVYEWTATAQDKKSGGKLGTAKARRDYPE